MSVLSFRGEMATGQCRQCGATPLPEDADYCSTQCFQAAVYDSDICEMSPPAESQDKRPSELLSERDHLREQPPENVRFYNELLDTTPSTLKPREAWCHECNSRITFSPDFKREYGHLRDCPHALEESNSWDFDK